MCSTPYRLPPNHTYAVAGLAILRPKWCSFFKYSEAISMAIVVSARPTVTYTIVNHRKDELQ